MPPLLIFNSVHTRLCILHLIYCVIILGAILYRIHSTCSVHYHGRCSLCLRLSRYGARPFYLSQVLTFTSRSWHLSYWPPNPDFSVPAVVRARKISDISIRQLGNDLFDQFPIQHKCNKYCQWFKLEAPSKILNQVRLTAARKKQSKGRGRNSIVPTVYNSD